MNRHYLVILSHLIKIVLKYSTAFAYVIQGVNQVILRKCIWWRKAVESLKKDLNLTKKYITSSPISDQTLPFWSLFKPFMLRKCHSPKSYGYLDCQNRIAHTFAKRIEPSTCHSTPKRRSHRTHHIHHHAPYTKKKVKCYKTKKYLKWFNYFYFAAEKL